MSTFTPDKPVTVKKLLVDLLILVGIVALIIIIDRLINTNLVLPKYYFTIAVLLLLKAGDFLATRRVNEIVIDPGKKEIVFSFKSVLSGPVKKVLPIANARLEEVLVRSPRLKIRKLITLYFLKNKVEVCKLSGSKDGFSSEVLSAIRQQADQLGIPIIRV